MANDIQLSKEEAYEYAEFLKTKLPAIDDKINLLIKEKESLLERISKLNGGANPSSPAIVKTLELIQNQAGKQIPDTIIGKIKYVLKENQNAPMTTRKIIDNVFKIQPHLALFKDKVSKNISTVLSINQGDGKTFNRTTGADGNFLFTINPQYMD